MVNDCLVKIKLGGGGDRDVFAQCHQLLFQNYSVTNPMEIAFINLK